MEIETRTVNIQEIFDRFHGKFEIKPPEHPMQWRVVQRDPLVVEFPKFIQPDFVRKTGNK